MHLCDLLTFTLAPAYVRENIHNRTIPPPPSQAPASKASRGICACVDLLGYCCTSLYSSHWRLLANNEKIVKMSPRCAKIASCPHVRTLPSFTQTHTHTHTPAKPVGLVVPVGLVRERTLAFHCLRAKKLRTALARTRIFTKCARACTKIHRAQAVPPCTAQTNRPTSGKVAVFT